MIIRTEFLNKLINFKDKQLIKVLTGVKNGITQYFQVSQTVLDENTLNRELKPLLSIKDHNEKFLLTLDEQPLTIHNGIKQINIIDWLLK